ncbi:MAG: DEAD/DEAH box helicase [Gemmatimonadota bacterium]|nr:DEAD/DEAH box helicase [Gemmatimonadota bacterium]
MPLSRFHPVVAQWFSNSLGPPTTAQSRGWEAIRSGRHTLIAAPTGSGKTLAAFLSALDDLLQEGLAGPLPDETRIVYVSPLKALSSDIHRNLAEPRREISALAEAKGLPPVRITAAVRTGDTPSSERAAMIRTPPHILVTTPESLYLLLTAERSRAMLRTVRAVIVDEIHAVIGSRRGAHLALSLERLQHLTQNPLQRIGLSATQKPIDEVARFLVGTRHIAPDGTANCAVIDEGHLRSVDLALEIPGAPLEAVMSGETWQEVYDRLATLVREHSTTLIFTNTRRLTERVTRHLGERVGADVVAAHHGSLAKEVRRDAEERLKAGKLKALVATASLELGIDIGSVDLVCQIGSTRRISTFVQRVGRSGHSIRGTPKGRLFALSRDDLIECAALLRSVKVGELDRILIHPKPLDVLSQHIVAETAGEDWSVDELFHLAQGAYTYRDLERREYDDVIAMLSSGFSTRRGRRGAMLHHDAVNGRVRGRRGARLSAITSGGAIPDTADYRVVLEPEGTVVGTLNEDFAIESSAGDIFQLGNTSWRIMRVEQGVVRVEDARGQPPTIPFWLGEAPGRSDELSKAVSDLRSSVEARLGDREEALTWLKTEAGLSTSSSQQIVEYLGEARRMLGKLPTQDALIMERFFDESGGMQLVLHSPFGSRMNRAWGLALRKRFCRQFNFELQAAATEDGLLLSLGPQHSFPLEDVFRYLTPEGVRDILIQALLDAPVFQTRWRWNLTISLAVPRNRAGRKVPPQLQRMLSDDLLAAVFPDAAACLENIPGDREIPDHPLVRQTMHDCLHEAMDLDALMGVLDRIRSGTIACIARDLPEPSPLSHEILNARPYAFLDDAPLEERRAHAVHTRRAAEPSSGDDLGALDPAAIERVRAEAWPDPTNADELHDALMTSGFLTQAEGEAGADGKSWTPFWSELVASGRAGRVVVGSDGVAHALWIAAERLHEWRAIFDELTLEPASLGPPSFGSLVVVERQDSVRELLRGRIEIAGPTTARVLARLLCIEEGEVEIGLLDLESQGSVLRGSFTSDTTEREWCDRRLLARIHRYTLNRLRAEIEPVSTADFMRFLFAWQRVASEERAIGLEGLGAVLTLLDGYELAAGAWEGDVLSARVQDYDPRLLDTLCLTGRIAWGRVSPRPEESVRFSSSLIRSTPIALFLREHTSAWLTLASAASLPPLSEYASSVLGVLERRGASFFQELVAGSGLLATQAEKALGELVSLGAATADGFTGLRALLTPSEKRKPFGTAARRRHKTVSYGVETAGRWSLLRGREARDDGENTAAKAAYQSAVEEQARVLLRRYGVVCKRVIARETKLASWRDLLLCYRRLEARGEIRGGRFVSSLAGEQFALPEAIGQLRAIRRADPSGELIAISAADPLNLAGIVTPGERVPALATNKVVYRDGVAIAAREKGVVRAFAEYDSTTALEIERAVLRKRVTPVLRAYLGRTG